MPEAAIEELDEHLVVVGSGPDLPGEGLIQAAHAAVWVHCLPYGLPCLALLRKHMPISGWPFSGLTGCQVEGYVILTPPAVTTVDAALAAPGHVSPGGQLVLPGAPVMR